MAAPAAVTTTLTIRHLGLTDGADRFEVVREGDGKRGGTFTMRSPHTHAVEGRPDSNLMAELQWYLEVFLDYPFAPETDHAERVLAGEWLACGAILGVERHAVNHPGVGLRLSPPLALGKERAVRPVDSDLDEALGIAPTDRCSPASAVLTHHNRVRIGGDAREANHRRGLDSNRTAFRQRVATSQTSDRTCGPPKVAKASRLPLGLGSGKPREAGAPIAIRIRQAFR